MNNRRSDGFAGPTLRSAACSSRFIDASDDASVELKYFGLQCPRLIIERGKASPDVATLTFGTSGRFPL
jgi:hypothetical protein